MLPIGAAAVFQRGGAGPPQEKRKPGLPIRESRGAGKLPPIGPGPVFNSDTLPPIGAGADGQTVRRWRCGHPEPGPWRFMGA